MEGTGADDNTLLYEQGKITQVLIQLVERAGKHLPCISIAINERLYRLNVRYPGLAYHIGKTTLFALQSQLKSLDNEFQMTIKTKIEFISKIVFLAFI